MGKYEDMLKDYRQKNNAKATQQPQKVKPVARRDTSSGDPYSRMLEDYRKEQEQQEQTASGDPYSDMLAEYRKKNNQPQQALDKASASAAAEAAQRRGQAMTEHYTGLRDLREQRERDLAELNDLEANAGYITDADAGLASAARRKELAQSLEQADAALGITPRYYTNADRAAGVLAGSVIGQGASYTNAAGTLASMAGATDETGRILNDSAYSGYLTDPLAIEQARAAVENGWRPESMGILEQQEKFAERAFNTADRLYDKSSGYMAKAKEGASGADRLMVDLTQGAVDLAGDTLASAILPGSGLLLMGARSFGNEAMQRRHEGADISEQILAGAKSAAIEILTEKIGGPFEKAYGGTLLGKKTAQMVERLGKNPSTRRLLSLLGDGLSEGFEEILSDALNPAADRLLKIYHGDQGYFEQIFSKDFMMNALYDGALGGLLGMAGGVSKIARNGGDIKSPQVKEAAKQAGAEAAQAAVDQAVEKKAAEAQEAALERDAPKAPQEAAGEPVPQRGTEIAPTGAETPTAAPVELNSAPAIVEAEATPEAATEAAPEAAPPAVETPTEAAPAKTVANERVTTPTVQSRSTKPGDHIDKRNAASVGSRGVKAFQYDHPEIRPFYAKAAQYLMEDFGASIQSDMNKRKGGRGYHKTQLIDRAMREFGLSRNQAMAALQQIINDNGAENNAAAKRMELLLDDMLTNGYWPVDRAKGNFQADPAYLEAKGKISGGNSTSSDEYRIQKAIESEIQAAMLNGETLTEEQARENVMKEYAETGYYGIGDRAALSQVDAGRATDYDGTRNGGDSDGEAGQFERPDAGTDPGALAGREAGTGAAEYDGGGAAGGPGPVGGQNRLASLGVQERAELTRRVADATKNLTGGYLAEIQKLDAAQRDPVLYDIADMLVSDYDNGTDISGFAGELGDLTEILGILDGAVTKSTAAAEESAGTAETEAAEPQTPAEEQPSNRKPYESRGRRGGAASGTYEELGERYGTIEAGENPARESAVPKQIDERRKVGEAVRTLYEASATPEERLADIRNAVVGGELSYISVSNESLAKEAESRIRKDGWEASLRDFLADVRSGKTGDRLTALGAVLYNNAANSGMDGKSLVDLVVAYNDLMHNMGRGLAAGRILKTLTPEAKLYAIQKTVSRMNEEAAEKRAKKEAKEQKKREKQASRKGNTEPKPKYADKRGNIPVSMWAERAGETVADSMAKKLEEAGLTKPVKVKTVAQQAEADIKKVLKSYSETKSMNISAEALENILNNPRFALDLYENLRNSLEQKSGLTREEIESLGMDWINEPLADVLGQMAAKDKNIHIDEKLADEFLKAETDEERDEILDRIKQNIADQIPSTIRDKWNALRYLNMLGNFKTQIRNLTGNATMLTTASLIKNHMIRGSIEGVAHALSGGRFEKNTSVLYNPKLAAEAWADFKNVEKEALGERKYSDAGRQVENDIQEKRRIFKFEPLKPVANLIGKAAPGAKGVADKVSKAASLEGYRLATNWTMEMGDQIFSRTAYADAMAGWMQAHKVKHISDMTPEMLDRARAFAIKEAQEATFRDTNGLSDWASKLGRSGNEKGFGKFMGLVGEGIMPFRKTPANVLMRAYEYSPLGVFNVIGQSIQSAKGNATGSDVVNALSKTFTGTGLAFVGYMLARAGKLRTKDDDDKLEQFHKDQGAQDYALDIGDGKNITLDWLAPDSIPLFMGAEMEKIVRQGGISGDDALEILSQLTEPMLEMSMLSGLNDALELSNSYDNTVGALPNLVLNSILGYATQGLNNSLIRQAEQASEKVRRTSYTDPNSPLPSSVQRKISQFFGGIPGKDVQQQDYIDVWGRNQEQGSTGERVLQSFLNPAYVGRGRSTKYDGELERLYNAGYKSALPQKPARSTEVNGERLTPEEYETYATVAGQKKLELIGDFLDSEEYKTMSDEDREEVISNLYSYANHLAASDIAKMRGEKMKESSHVKSMEKLRELDKNGGSAVDYLLAKQGLKTATDGKDYKAVDALLGDIDKMDKATQEQLFADVSRLDDRVEAHRAGINTALWEAVYAQKKKLEEDKSTTAVQDVISMAQYVDSYKNLNQKQKDLLREQMGFYTTFRADADKFDQMMGAGLSADKAGTAWNTIHDLKPLAGKSTVSAAQKVQAISGMRGFSDAEKWTVFACYLQKSNESLYKNAMKAKDSGKSFDQWVQSYTKGK